MLPALVLVIAWGSVPPATFGNDLHDLRTRKRPVALANCVFGALRDAGTPATLASHQGVFHVSDGRAFQVATTVAAGAGTGLDLERRPDEATMARYRELVSDCL